MYKEFENSLKKVIEILEDKTILENYKYEVVENFSQIYINFDTSKFDKYFIED